MLFHVTAAIFVQLLLGGLFVLNFIGGEAHIYVGVIVGILALATMILALISKPKYDAFRLSSIVLFVLIVLQGALGFSAFNSEINDQLVFVHFVNAMLIYGIAIAGVFYAVRWNRMMTVSGGEEKQVSPPPPAPDIHQPGQMNGSRLK